MSAALNALREEGSRDDLLAAIERLMDEKIALRQRHDVRVAELLEANNREVERRRRAEAEGIRLRAVLESWIGGTHEAQMKLASLCACPVAERLDAATEAAWEAHDASRGDTGLDRMRDAVIAAAPFLADAETQRAVSAFARVRDGIGHPARIEQVMVDHEIVYTAKPKEDWRPTHRHLKRGTVYRLLFSAVSVQAGAAIVEGDTVAIYESEAGQLWCRPVKEFTDGRFEAIMPPGTAAQEGS